MGKILQWNADTMEGEVTALGDRKGRIETTSKAHLLLLIVTRSRDQREHVRN